MQEEQFTHTATRLRQQLLAVARGILHDEVEAEDAVQDALVSLWRMGERVQTEADAARLAVRITRNMSLNRLKHRTLAATALSALSGDALHRLTARQDNPHETLERQEAERRVAAAIAALPRAQQAVILLHHLDDLSYGQIAAIWGSTESAVRMTASRAKANLIQQMKHQRR